MNKISSIKKWIYACSTGSICALALILSGPLTPYIVDRADRSIAAQYVAQGNASYHMGKSENAARYARLAIAYDKTSSAAHNNYGHYLMNKGMSGEAERELKTAISLNRQNVSAYINLGALKSREMEYHEAAEVLKKAISLDNESVTAHYNLGVVLYELNEIESSLEQFIKTEQLDPLHKASIDWMSHIFTNHPHLRQAPPAKTSLTI